MHLIKDDELPVPTFGSIKQAGVLGPEQEVFEHRVVGQQNVRRLFAYCFPGDPFVTERFLIQLAPVSLISRSVLFLGVTDVAPERHLWETLQERPKPLHLVVGESVHRIEEKRPYAGFAERSGCRLSQ